MEITQVPIAIVGAACHLPGGADCPHEYWEILAAGVNTWSKVPEDRFNEAAFFHRSPDDPNGSNNHKGGHFIRRDVRDFDNEFFGISSQEAAAMDPQQRILLETVFEALESAGQQQRAVRGSDTSVYVALFTRDYDRNIYKDTLNIPRHHIVACGEAIAANRISHAFDLRGPSVTLDTGCSGGLVAVHQACSAIKLGECDMAIAAAANLILSPDHQTSMSNLHMLNEEGRSYPFDQRGNGYGRGEGFAAFVLKRLDKAIEAKDPIRGVILGSAVNQDGRTIAGITHPSSAAQAWLQQRLYQKLEIDPATILYVEAHGTGTIAGDQEEIDALAKVFCSGRNFPLYVGSAKSNIGHLESSSGPAGLLKTMLALEHRKIPPNAHFEREKDGLQLDDKRIVVPTTLESWPEYASPRASVNSFGYGGTNAHIVMQAAPLVQPSLHDVVDYAPRLFVFSAKSKRSLANMILRYRKWIPKEGADLSLSSLSHTLCNRRTHFAWRFGCVAKSSQDLTEQLSSAVPVQSPTNGARDIPLNFIFTGQGAQWPGMGRELLLRGTPSVFVESMRRSRDMLFDLGAEWDLLEEILMESTKSKIHDAELAQPTTTAVQIALVDLIRALGVVPNAVVGHSSGEVAAAYAAGVISQATALRISFYRGLVPKIASRKFSRKGAMLAVGLNADEASGYMRQFNGRVVVACINSPENSTLSGDEDAIDELSTVLNSAGIFNRKLRVDTAYHSHHMRSVAREYKELMRSIRTIKSSSKIQFISTVSGRDKSSGFDADYWVDNLVSKVRFHEAIQLLCRDNTTNKIFLEIGPHHALAGPTRQCITGTTECVQYDYLSLLKRGVDTVQGVLETMGKLFERGKNIDFGLLSTLDPSHNSATVLSNLPSYSWDHTRKHWHESRLSREYLMRKHPYHDLLGIKTPESTSFEPSWRHMIGTTTLPWLADHVVDGLTVFPGSGYLCMAIEAGSQIARETLTESQPLQITLKDVKFIKALIVPDSPQRTEIQINLSALNAGAPKRVGFQYRFRVSAFRADHTWDEHCRGVISVVPMHIDDMSGFSGVGHENGYNKMDTVRSTELYRQLKIQGNAYGPSFAGIDKMTLTDNRALSTVVIPDIAGIMPANYSQSHTIHPSTLDMVMHTSLPLAARKFGPGPIMPISIAELVVTTQIDNTPRMSISVHTRLGKALSRTFETDIKAINARDNSISLSLSGVKLQVLEPSLPKENLPREIEHTCWQLSWGFDVNHLSDNQFKAPQVKNGGKLSFSDALHTLNRLTTAYIEKCLSQIDSGSISVVEDHSMLVDWMRRQQNDCSLRKRSAQNDDTTNGIPAMNDIQDVQMEVVARTGEQLPGIVSGRVDALQLVMEDDLLFRAYQDRSSKLCYDLLRQYVTHLTFKKSKLRILEIGAGTGGATRPFLETMKVAGFTPALYDFTDISTGFFERAAGLFSDYPIRYRRLDIEKEPAQQGFDTHSYDVVLAFNCLHVTSSISNTLRNVRSLLAPDGRLILIEIVNAQPYHHISFGTLPGYWKGSSDGRPDGPFMTIDQWRPALMNAGMELQLNKADDESAHVSSLMIARPCFTANKNKNLNRVQIRTITKSMDGLASRLASVLGDRGYNAAIANFYDDFGNNNGISIVLDDGEHPLLSHLTPEAFGLVRTLLGTQAQIMWVSASQHAETYNAAAKHLIAGLARTAHAENDRLRLVTVDVQQSIDEINPQTLDLLIDCMQDSLLLSVGSEREFVIRGDAVLVPRIIPNAILDGRVRDAQQAADANRENFAVRSTEILNGNGVVAEANMKTCQTNGSIIAEDEIELDVHALAAPSHGNESRIQECSGTVVAVGAKVCDLRVGDRVMAITGHAYTRRLQMLSGGACLIPDDMTHTTAAALPMALVSAYHALFDLAGTRPGNKIFIHGFSHLVSRVVLAIAKSQGVEAIVLASTQSDLSLLKERFGVTPECIIYGEGSAWRRMHRVPSTQDLDAIITHDIAALPSQISDNLKAFGTVVYFQGESNERVDLGNRFQLPPNTTLHSCDINALMEARPEIVQRLFKQAQELILKARLCFSEIPVVVKPASEMADILRLAESADRTVFEMHSHLTPLAADLAVSDFDLGPNATYVIAGGLGDLGQRLLGLLAAHGAKHVVTLSRRSLDEREQERLWTTLGKHCKFHHFRCDISHERDVRSAMSSIKALGLPPIRGVIQSTLMLQDRTINSMTLDDFKIPLETKLTGTLNLQKVFGKADLEFFIMLSSSANIIGTSGQGNYNAGNAVQDALAHIAASQKCHYLTINVGMVEGTSAITDHDTRNKALIRSGLTLLKQEYLDSILLYALSPAARADRLSQIVTGFDSQSLAQADSVNGNIRSSMFAHVFEPVKAQVKKEQAIVVKTFKETLETEGEEAALNFTAAAVQKKLSGLTSTDLGSMNLDKSISDFGLDSLVAIELKNWIRREFKASLQSLEILNEGSINMLAKKIVERAR